MSTRTSPAWLKLVEREIDSWEPCLDYEERHLRGYADNVAFDVDEVAAAAKKLFDQEKTNREIFSRQDVVELAEELVCSVLCEIGTALIYQQHEEELRLQSEEWRKINRAVSAFVLAVEEALDVRMRPAGSSYYTEYRDLTIRVSDHEQVEGGGWSEERQERNGESDISWTVDVTAAIPDRAAIRGKVAMALLQKRREEHE